MISALAMCRAARAANSIISTAPMAKFGRDEHVCAASARAGASRSKPVVPITTCTPGLGGGARVARAPVGDGEIDQHVRVRRARRRQLGRALDRRARQSACPAAPPPRGRPSPPSARPRRPRRRGSSWPPPPAGGRSASSNAVSSGPMPAAESRAGVPQLSHQRREILHASPRRSAPSPRPARAAARRRAPQIRAGSSGRRLTRGPGRSGP